MKTRPPVHKHVVRLDTLRDVAKRRNVRLRVLHGSVDVEPSNMDAAKAEYLDRQEKKQAAIDVRAARARMQEELAESSTPGAGPKRSE
jgi:F420-dependent methylenetetrahydromethanopterin dehydrogenase